MVATCVSASDRDAFSGTDLPDLKLRLQKMHRLLEGMGILFQAF